MKQLGGYPIIPAAWSRHIKVIWLSAVHTNLPIFRFGTFESVHINIRSADLLSLLKGDLLVWSDWESTRKTFPRIRNFRSDDVLAEFPSRAEFWCLMESTTRSPPHSVNNGRQQSHDCHAGDYEQDLQQRLPGKYGKKRDLWTFPQHGRVHNNKAPQEI